MWKNPVRTGKTKQTTAATKKKKIKNNNTTTHKQAIRNQNSSQALLSIRVTIAVMKTMTGPPRGGNGFFGLCFIVTVRH